MNRVGVAALAAFLSLALCRVARAQEPPPRIGPFVVDLQGNVPRFGDDPVLAQSRDLAQNELPGAGLGATAGIHVYLARLGAVTFGVGGQATIGQSHAAPSSGAAPPTRRITETFTSLSPQISLNFGDGDGWSYLSVGVGRARWSVVPDDRDPLPADEAALSTINYGGGARWFIKQHLAFSLDVRLHEIKAGAPQGTLPGTPHTVLMVVSAGISVK